MTFFFDLYRGSNEWGNWVMILAAGVAAKSLVVLKFNKHTGPSVSKNNLTPERDNYVIIGLIMLNSSGIFCFRSFDNVLCFLLSRGIYSEGAACAFLSCSIGSL